jgi:small subunit ribosomal protein S16
MLVIRLQRRGKTNQPFYKIIVTDKRNAPKAGVSVEEIGYINPITKEKSVNKERAQHWISVGAQPSDTVYNLLVSEGIIDGSKRKVTVKPCKNPKK